MELSIINGTYRSAIGPKNTPSMILNVHYHKLIIINHSDIPRLSMLSPVHSPMSPLPFIQSAAATHQPHVPFFGSPLPSPNKEYKYTPRSVPPHHTKGHEPSFDFTHMLRQLDN